MGQIQCFERTNQEVAGEGKRPLSLPVASCAEPGPLDSIPSEIFSLIDGYSTFETVPGYDSPGLLRNHFRYWLADCPAQARAEDKAKVAECLDDLLPFDESVNVSMVFFTAVLHGRVRLARRMLVDLPDQVKLQYYNEVKFLASQAGSFVSEETIEAWNEGGRAAEVRELKYQVETLLASNLSRVVKPTDDFMTIFTFRGNWMSKLPFGRLMEALCRFSFDVPQLAHVHLTAAYIRHHEHGHPWTRQQLTVLQSLIEAAVDLN